ncbi:glycerol dehydrogenase [Pseudomonas syringae]|uniref:glycerol dehydrogenase n=1 Tax=Pseudomonas syringae TaxID=317 RepID=UPI001F3BCA65|nr:glycerol dehydrogenase [Pseudomonas syringae]MCF5225412.1 iron-containing alcohol dehydrogenase [Pseudomonas syringae]MCF5241817.1 iron-containing alcohol dehydrogenase [Pseudomonas syringae]
MNIIKGIASPGKFLVQADALKDLATHGKPYGAAAYLICDQFIVERVRKKALPGFSNEQQGELVVFGGQCSDSEIEKHVQAARSFDYIVGIGGGKTLDTAKATAHLLGKPVLIVPTLASTDAPCTAISVIYNDDDTFNRYLFLAKNPDLVLADTRIMAEQPVRFFAAGVGDGLATYFEARACFAAQRDNLILGTDGKMLKPTLIGFAIAQTCYETIRKYAAQATYAVQKNVITAALENTIEATIYMSAVGAESGGCAAAHAIHNGMTLVHDLHGAQHGEKVVFGLFTQLVMEAAPVEEIEEIVAIAIAVGLPLTLEDLGLKSFVEQEWRKVAEAACDKNDTIHNMPFRVTPELVYDAIVATDALLRSLKKQKLNAVH